VDASQPVPGGAKPHLPPAIALKSFLRTENSVATDKWTSDNYIGSIARSSIVATNALLRWRDFAGQAGIA
jgi:hypothetical protein